MGIKWEDIHFGISPITNSIFIGKSKLMKNNPKVSEWIDKSKDMSNECMYAVACKLKQKELESKDDKGYYGYEYSDGSKLIYIVPNHKIEVTKIEDGGNEINV